ncbi:uncharacterized mitochondrial protein AtMg00310-like [Vicia villosa]|uniref:uncharacterized mitochondrial protein AtMg00310-like n=1 Tax=Vicia villosa TaxID=3911 RepID=UPI00273B5C7C|nr:uncharacterized mitochondrial protein AtMg00310-like [Vicia villosa]
MIKSVLQAIPTYIMSIFILPDVVVNEIEKMLNLFWWGGGSNSKGIRWKAWDKLTCPKAEGGLGFRDFKAFNLAMVAKQGWFLMTNLNALVSRIFKARCFPRSSFFMLSWVIILALFGGVFGRLENSLPLDVDGRLVMVET